MKRKIIMGAVGIITTAMLVGCGQNLMTKTMGGTMTVELEPNTKLVNATWKDANLWYLTKPMDENDEPEVSVFQQKSEFGIFEGKVVFIETKQTKVTGGSYNGN